MYIAPGTFFSAFTSSPTSGAPRNAVSPEDAFSLYFNHDIIQISVNWINKVADAVASKRQATPSTFAPTVPLEVKALLGLPVISDQKNDEHAPICAPWIQVVLCNVC